MKSSSLSSFLFYILYSLNIFSQAPPPAIEWQKTLGGSSGDWATSIQQTSDGGFIVAGHSNSNDGDVSGNHGSWDFWVVKLSDLGDLVWQRSFGGSENDIANSVQETSDGGFIVAGYTLSNDGDVTGFHGDRDAWVIKLDVQGDLIWQNALGGSLEDRAYSVQETSDGGFIVAGYSDSNDGDVSGNHGFDDMWVVKLDVLGDLAWQRSFGGSYQDLAFSVQQTSDGGFVVAGYTTSIDGDVMGNNGFQDMWVVKLDVLGDLVWQSSLGGSFGESANSIQETSDGGFVVAGYATSTDGDVTGFHGGQDMWVVKLDGFGDLVWQRSLGGSLIDWANSIQQTSDGGIVVAGYSRSVDGDATVNNGLNDFWVVRMDVLGDLVWQRSLGGSVEDRAGSIQQTSDGGFIVAGYSFSVDGDVTGNHGGQDMWVVKLASVNGIDDVIEDHFSISPNPSNGIFYIELNELHGASLTITEALGKEVLSTKVHEQRTTLDLSQEPKGIYLVNVQTEQGIISRKLVLE